MTGIQRKGDFSPEGYERIVRAALAAGYRIACFREFEPEPGPNLILRHDLDHSLRSAAAIGRIEREMGVRATYFVQVACDFYNLLSHESREILAELVESGHEIGLHYDSRRYAGSDGEDRLRRDAALLEELAQTRIVSVSQHIPIDTPPLAIGALFPIDAYHPRYTQDIAYISDSLMRWRQAHPLDLIKARLSFQLLIHPMNWVHSAADIAEALRHAEEEDVGHLRRLYGRTRSYYASLLANRTALDASYHARASGHRRGD